MVTDLIWRAAGSPVMLREVSGACRSCGCNGTGLAFDGWVRDTFTDHDKLKPGSICCQACQFCFTDQNETLGKVLGKDGPQRFRNYSHFVLRGDWIAVSKGGKAKMIETLLQSPEIAVIATSGQKHIAFRALPNWWQIEEVTVRPFPEKLRFLLETIQPLYDSGISKAEIETGRFSHKRIMDFGLDKWHAAESALSPLRGSIQLELALFLAQHTEDYDAERNSGAPIVADLARDSRRVQEQVRAEHLEPVREQPTQRSLYE